MPVDQCVVFKEGPLQVCCACALESGPLYWCLYRTEAAPLTHICSRCNNLSGRTECETAAIEIMRQMKEQSHG